MNLKNSVRKRLSTYLRQAAVWGVVGLTLLVSAETTARLDDLYSEGIPFLANPDQSDLQIIDEYGVHGRPYAKFQNWKLNNFGFRGPDIRLDPPAHCHRVMILGASETFGYLEAPGMEFPAQLQRRLAKIGCFEVINAAVVGMELASMRRYWESWASRFLPDLVMIYPSPHFYLNESVTRRAVGQPSPIPAPKITDAAGRDFSSRFVLRLHNVFHWPYFIQKYRDARNIARQVVGKDPSWYFHAVPEDRLRMFAVELEMLVASVQRAGATPILMAHAYRAAQPPRAEDYRDLEAFRVYMPRATPEAIVLFEAAANNEIRRIAAEHQLVLIDPSPEVGGCRECFGDLVHFTDRGASIVTDEIVKQIQPLLFASRKPTRAVQ
jgi:hypothetical protein